MKVIVTGASGFIGKNLCSFLADIPGVEVVMLNLRAPFPARLPKADAVIHLAGVAHDLKKTIDENRYFEVNYRLTERVFRLFLEAEINDFFFFSSVKAAADHIKDVLHEDHKPSPKTSYGKSKLEAEQALLSTEMPTSKRLFVIRPCLTHGPGNKGNLNLLYKLVKKGIPYPLSAFENQRSFLSIDNLNYLIHEMLKNKSVRSGIYNFADDGYLSTNEVIDCIARALGKKARRWALPRWLIIMLAKVGDVLHLPLSSERLTKMTESFMVSNEKIKNALDIDTLPVSAEEGLIKTIKSFPS